MTGHLGINYNSFITSAPIVIVIDDLSGSWIKAVETIQSEWKNSNWNRYWSHQIQKKKKRSTFSIDHWSFSLASVDCNRWNWIQIQSDWLGSLMTSARVLEVLGFNYLQSYETELRMFDEVMAAAGYRWMNFPSFSQLICSLCGLTSSKLIKSASSASSLPLLPLRLLPSSFLPPLSSPSVFSIHQLMWVKFRHFFFFQSHRNRHFKGRNALDSHSNNVAIQLDNAHLINQIFDE